MNAIATVFLCEAGDREVFLKTVDRIQKLKDIYSGNEHVLKTLITWLMYYLHTHGKVEEAAQIGKTIPIKKEAETMLYKTIQQLKEDYKREGIQIGLQKGLAKGISKGKREGVKEGIQKGLQKGLQKGMMHSKVEIVKKMLQEGFDEKTIMKITNLQAKDIQKIKRKG